MIVVSGDLSHAPSQEIANAFFSKPYDLNVVLTRVKELLNVTRRDASPRWSSQTSLRAPSGAALCNCPDDFDQGMEIGRGNRHLLDRPLLSECHVQDPPERTRLRCLHSPGERRDCPGGQNICQRFGCTVLGIFISLTIADLTAGSGQFNLAQGVVGTMSGLGASVSTALFGQIMEPFGRTAAFMSTAAMGLAAVLLLWLLMPETGSLARNRLSE